MSTLVCLVPSFWFCLHFHQSVYLCVFTCLSLSIYAFLCFPVSASVYTCISSMALYWYVNQTRKKFGTGVLSGDVRKRSSAEVVAFNALLRALQCLPDNRLLWYYSLQIRFQSVYPIAICSQPASRLSVGKYARRIIVAIHIIIIGKRWGIQYVDFTYTIVLLEAKMRNYWLIRSSLLCILSSICCSKIALLAMRTDVEPCPLFKGKGIQNVYSAHVASTLWGLDLSPPLVRLNGPLPVQRTVLARNLNLRY